MPCSSGLGRERQLHGVSVQALVGHSWPTSYIPLYFLCLTSTSHKLPQRRDVLNSRAAGCLFTCSLNHEVFDGRYES